jgi:hypothetical protein
MSRKFASTVVSSRRQIVANAAFLGSLLALLSFGGVACEDRAIGRPCEVGVDAGQNEAVFEAQALECPSRLCVKPGKDTTTVAKLVDTSAYCSAECSKDSDCEGETRNVNNARDRRCKGGFVCGVGFENGPLCCKKICICKDFLSDQQVAGGLKTPSSCLPGGFSNCVNIK